MSPGARNDTPALSWHAPAVTASAPEGPVALPAGEGSWKPGDARADGAASPRGTQPSGHRGSIWAPTAAQHAAWDAQEAAEREAAVSLACWLEAEGIAKGDHAADVARSLAGDETQRRRFEADPGSVRAAAVAVADLTSMTPAALSALLVREGHARHPGSFKIGEVIND